MIRFLLLTLSILLLPVWVHAQTDWTVRQSNSGDLLYDVVFTDDMFVVVGTTTAPVTVLTSPDGITWTRQDAGIGGIFYSVAYGDGKVVAVGTNTASSIAAVSDDDGESWTGGPVNIGPIFEGVTWTGSEFIAVGGTGEAQPSAVIASSTDGETWTGGPVGFGTQLKGVVLGGTTLVAVGSNGGILYSQDGGDWMQAENIPTVDWEDVTYAAGKFLAVGVQGLTMTSPDGVNWTLVNTNTGGNLFGAASIGSPEVWVGVGTNGNGLVIVSNDITSWTAISPPPTAAILEGVAWGVPTGETNSLFVAVGNLGQIITSPGPEVGGGTPATFVEDPINITSMSQQFTAQVTAGGTTTWNASTGEDWIFLGAATGTGNGEFTGSVTANQSAQPRTGTITIGTDTLSLIQAGADLTPPNFLSASYSESDGGIKLSWGTVNAAEAFVIERRLGDEGDWEVVLNVTNEPTNMAVDDTIVKGNTYQYRIRSISGDLESAWTDPTEGGSPPDTPANFTATARNATQIELTWSDVNGETSYQINRAKGDEFFDGFIQVGPNETRFIDAGLDPETEYRYTIQALATQFSPESPETSATTLERSGSILWGESESVSNNYNGVAFGNGTAVVVGDSGRITRSTDLASWTDVASGTEEDLLHVHFANNLFVAVGEGGTSVYSSDGLTWNTGSSSTNESLVSVSYLNGWYAVGAGGALITSADGATWSSLTSPAESGFIDIFAGSKLVAIEDTGRFVTSEDGTSWTETRANAPGDETEPFFWTRTAGAFGGGIYGVVGPASYTSTSEDASSWSDQTGGQFQYFDAVAYGGDRFVAVANRSGYSAGGQFYAEGDDPPSLLTCITYTGSVFLAAGNRGLIVTSTDGDTWTTVQEAEGSAANFRLVASGGGRLVALGSQFNQSGFQETVTIYNPLDGSGWSDEMPLTVDGVDSDPFFSDLVYLNGQFILIGSNGAILTSPNGEVFTTRNSEAGFSGPTFSSVAYHDGRYLAAGFGITLYESIDSGVTWSPVEDLLSGFSAQFLTYDSRWSGGSGEYYSNDGETWIQTTISGFGADPEVFTTGSYANAPLLVNIGRDFSGTSTALSSDGRNWNIRSFESNSVPEFSFNALAFGAGVFVAVNFPNEAGDAVWASIDGVHWEPASSRTFEEGFFDSNTIDDVVFNESDGAFYAVGGQGLVVRFEVSSSDFVPPGPEHRLGIGLVGNMINIDWPTDPNFSYLLRYNDGLDPATWIAIGDSEVGDGTTKTYQVSKDAITIPRFWSLQIEEN